MSKPKKHHTNAVMFSKRFAGSDGFLHIYDKRHPGNGIRRGKPENEFVIGHFHTQFDAEGKKDASVETDFLSSLESDAGPVLDKVISNAQENIIPQFKAEERETLIRFIYCQYIRVPEFRSRHVEDLQKRVRRMMEFEGLFPSLGEEVLEVLEDDRNLERLSRNASIECLRLKSERVLGYLSEKRIRYAVVRKPRPKRGFVIGSNPVLKTALTDRGPLSDPSAQVYLALSRDVAIQLFSGEGDRLVSLKDRNIESLNRSVMEQSEVIAGCSRVLVESLVSSAGG